MTRSRIWPLDPPRGVVPTSQGRPTWLSGGQPTVVSAAAATTRPNAAREIRGENAEKVIGPPLVRS